MLLSPFVLIVLMNVVQKINIYTNNDTKITSRYKHNPIQTIGETVDQIKINATMKIFKGMQKRCWQCQQNCCAMVNWFKLQNP